MGGVFKKAAKLTTKIAGLAGGDKLVGGVFDSTLGTDVLGEKAAQERARAAEAAKNQEMLNSQLNSNIIGNSGVNNIVQTEAGGSAANSSASLDDNKRRRMGNISSTLGL